MDTSIKLEFEELPIEAVVTKTDKFRVQNQRLFLTYAQCGLAKDRMKEFFKEEFSKSYPNAKWWIAEELHADGGAHRHVLVNFGKAFQTTNPRRFDIDNFHPNIAKVGPKVDDWCKLCFYMCKEDKSDDLKEDLLSKANAYVSLMQSESLAHYLFDNPSRNALDLRTRYETSKGFNFVIEPVPEPTAPWYQKAKIYIAGKHPNYVCYRDIIWFADTSGNSEKSLFSKWAFGNKDYCVINSIKTVADFMRCITNACKEGWTSKYMVVSLPREWNDDGALYTCIEMAKDGIITSNKYDSQSFRIRDDVMIFVVANRRPTFDKMTKDRWHLWDILPNKQCIQTLGAGLNNVSDCPAAPAPFVPPPVDANGTTFEGIYGWQ